MGDLLLDKPPGHEKLGTLPYNFPYKQLSTSIMNDAALHGTPKNGAA